MPVAPRRSIDVERDQVIEAGWAAEFDVHLGDDHVDPTLLHHGVGTERLTPKLGHTEVEVGDVVSVEDDPLGIALAVTDAEAVGEAGAHRASLDSPP